MRRFFILSLACLVFYMPAQASVVLEAAQTEWLSLGSAICTTYPFSVSGWFKVTNLTADHYVFFLGDSTALDSYLGTLDAAGTQVDSYRVRTRDATAISAATAGTYTTGAWLHIGGVFAGTASRMVYPNGGAGVENTATRAPGTPNATDIGRLGTTAPVYLDGQVAEVAVWCGVSLTEGNMMALAGGDNPLTIGTPTEYWRLFDTATGWFGNDLTVNNGGVTFNTGDHPPVDAPATRLPVHILLGR